MSTLQFSDIKLGSDVPCARVQLLLLISAVFASSLGLGVIIGYFGHPSSPACDGVCLGSDVPTKIIEDATEGITEKIIARIDAGNIRKNLEKYTAYPHLAGTDGERELGEELYRTWVEQGLDYVTNDTYDLLLSYPDQSDPNHIYLLDDNGNIQYTTQTVEKIVRDDQNDSRVVPPFNAYSAAGNVTNSLIYVNYGRYEDFELLTSNYGLNVSGHIVIARYGKIFRGDKVNIATSFGAIGMILYSDPADYSIDTSVEVYPDSWWLPGTGVQRGNVYTGSRGDPLTPGYPSTATAYRRNESEAELPTIPVHPIGYDDAYHFLSIMGGDEAPRTWQGNLNFTYKLGPGFNNATHPNWKVRIYVASYTERRNSSSVFGFIRGSVEPDRYVLLGNHRDAWVFGGIDPTSGTALMMEVSRVLAELVKEGWRPRRSIVFCSWGAEEYGLMGSYEWIENYLKNLADRAVIYLNVDLSVEGQASMRALGVPIVKDIVYEVSKKIRSANDASKTLYDEWLTYFPDKNDPSKPRITDLGSGSDYAGFIGIAGMPSLDVRYTHNYSIIDYPLYHSVYETFHLVSQHVDADFKYSLAIGQYWAEAARYVSDSLILPLSARSYASGLDQLIKDLDTGYGSLMRSQGITLDSLSSSAARFNDTANNFTDRATRLNRKTSLRQTRLEDSPMETRMYNDQIMRLERAFLDSEGLPPSRRRHKHVLFAPSSFDAYAGTTFPGLVDLMWRIDRLPADEQALKWEEVRRHLATIIYTIESAISVLKPTIKFN